MSNEQLLREALEEIALAGMTGTGQESEEAMNAWHARQAWKFIGIAARALDAHKAAPAKPTEGGEAELMAYVLQDELRNMATPRVVDIAYSAFMQGAQGKNKEDGGKCDWFNDTKPMVVEQIENIKRDLTKCKPAPTPPASQPAESGEAAGIKYTPGTWYEVKTHDELAAFFLSRLPAIREAAREHGYAIGLHGSLRRDMDLIAVPWRDGASDKDTLAHAIAMAAVGMTRNGAYQWEQKPAGRIATSLSCAWTPWPEVAGSGHIDLSVMGPFTTPPASQKHGEPVFWYRPRSDGGYEGPIHNDRTECVRKMSGAWVPLYTTPQPAQATQPAEVTDAAIDAATRHLYHNGKPTSKEYRVSIARAILALRPQQSGLTGCNCRWDGDTQVQWCELHLAHKEAIHEWAERAKEAEKQLALRPAAVPMTESDIEKVIEIAEKKLRHACSGVQGQVITIWHSIDAHIVRAAEAHHGITAQAKKEGA